MSQVSKSYLFSYDVVSWGCRTVFFFYKINFIVRKNLAHRTFFRFPFTNILANEEVISKITETLTTL